MLSARKIVDGSNKMSGVVTILKEKAAQIIASLERIEKFFCKAKNNDPCLAKIDAASFLVDQN